MSDMDELMKQTLEMVANASNQQQVNFATWLAYNSIYFKMKPEEILKVFEKCLRLVRGEKK